MEDKLLLISVFDRKNPPPPHIPAQGSYVNALTESRWVQTKASYVIPVSQDIGGEQCSD